MGKIPNKLDIYEDEVPKQKDCFRSYNAWKLS